MIYILDACAMIALLRDEPGADVVEDCLCDVNNACFAHSINLCELYYDFFRVGGESAALQAVDDMKDAGVIERNDFDQPFWQDAGKIKAVHRHVSLADCMALSLAQRLSGSLLTSDHHEFDPIASLGIYNIVFFR
ncbi:MAG: PIN domain-containing protein [Acidobacteriota bacterium]